MPGSTPAAACAADGGQRLDAALLAASRRHEHEAGGAVVAAGRVAGGDAAALLEDRLELGQLLQAGAARVLVGVEDRRRALASRDLHRHDLVREAAALDGGDGALLAAQRERVLLLARDVVLLGEVLGREPHGEVAVDLVGLRARLALGVGVDHDGVAGA